jgi:hypothetical protein
MTERKHQRTARLLNPYTGPDTGAQDFGDTYGVPSHEGNRVLTPEEVASMQRNSGGAHIGIGAVDDSDDATNPDGPTATTDDIEPES